MNRLCRVKGCFVFLLLFTVVLIVGCSSKTVFNHYIHTPISGWEKNDTIVFSIPRIKEAGDYELSMGIRISRKYPFIAGTFIIEQVLLPKEVVYIDTVNCTFVTKDGKYISSGTTYFNYEMPVATIPITAGDSLYIRIRHDMKRDILPGISDVGVVLSHKQ